MNRYILILLQSPSILHKKGSQLEEGEFSKQGPGAHKYQILHEQIHSFLLHSLRLFNKYGSAIEEDSFSKQGPGAHIV